jgi:aspartate aminotransferase
MAQLSDRLNRLAPSATLAMSQKSSEMKAQGIDVINMSVGEPDFNTPENIKEAAKKAIDDNFSRYSPVPGYPDLRKAIVAKLKNENGLDYTVNEVIVGTGGKQGICNVILALVNPGDECLSGGVWICQCLDGLSSVVCRNTCGASFQFVNSYRKRSAQHRVYLF